MSKLALNDDGTITLPLRNKDAVTLPEPSIAQLAEMTGYVSEADDGLGEIPIVEEDADTVAIRKANTELRERTKKTYSAEAPYGVAVIKIVKLLTDASVTLDDLPSWAASPSTCRSILGHWQTPLAGED